MVLITSLINMVFTGKDLKLSYKILSFLSMLVHNGFFNMFMNNCLIIDLVMS